jgi:hypothetical protein
MLTSAIVASTAFRSDVVPSESDDRTIIDNGFSEAVDAKILSRFIQNDGQWSSDIAFVATTNFGSAAFTPHGFFYYLPTSDDNCTDAIAFSFLGANEVQPTGTSRLPSVSNYLIGNDPSEWHTGIPEYGKIVYRDLWEGVDLTFYFTADGLKYEMSVDPDVGVDVIAIQVNGADISVQDHDLVIAAASATLVDGGLMAYYAGGTEAVGASFVVDGDRYSFHLANRDLSRAVIIDPLVYSTYLGGNGIDMGYSIAVDSSGCAYVTGDSSSYFPTTSGAYRTSYSGGSYDVFISKLSADGSDLLYSTYLGGSDSDIGLGIAVDPSGCAYVTGRTGSSNYPTVSAYQGTSGGSDDAFISKLSADGASLVYSTYLGGGGTDYGLGIAVDSSGCAYVTGQTYSLTFPSFSYKRIIGGSSDAFISKLSADGSSLDYSTYIGGLGYDSGQAISIDPSGCAYVTGQTNSLLFATIGAYQVLYGGGSYDAFVSKLSADGSDLLYLTYLGGSDSDSGQAIAVDSSGCAYVTGQTHSSNFPTINAFQSASGGSLDTFVTKLIADGSDLTYSTYIGGSKSDYGYDLAVDPSGCAYVVGYTESSDFPIREADQTTFGGAYDVFVSKLNAGGSNLVYSTYLGGGGTDYGLGIAIDPSGCAYVTGHINSSDFTTTGAYQVAYGGGSDDAFITKLNPVRPPSAPIALTAIPGSTNVSLSWNAPDDVGPGIDHYLVYQDGLSIAQVTTASCLVTGLTSGQSYEFNVSAYNAGGNGDNATIMVTPDVHITVQVTSSAQYADASTASAVTATVSALSDLSLITLASANVSHYVNGVVVSNNAIAVSGRAYVTTQPIDLAVGTNTFTYTFNDSVGNSVSDSITVIYDVVKPTVTVTSPSNNSLNNTGSVTVHWTTADDRSGIKTVEYRLDGSDWMATIATGSHSWNGLADGPHTVSLRATDNAGNANTTSITFLVDTVKPTLTINSPSNNSHSNSGSVDVAWDADDLLSGVISIEYRLDGSDWIGTSDSHFIWSDLADGAHTFLLRSTDNAGNVNTTLVTIFVDTVKPTIVVDSPDSGSYNNTGSVTIRWSAADDRSGIMTVERSLDGGDWATVTGETRYDWTGLSDGQHILSLRATDNAGNVNTAQVAFTVDTAKPTLAIGSPEDGSYNNTGSLIVSWTGADALSGIAYYDVSIDSGTSIRLTGTNHTFAGLSDGPHLIKVTAADMSGNVEDAEIEIIVDAMAPDLIVASPADRSMVNSSTLIFSWAASDDAPIAHFLVRVDGGEWQYLGAGNHSRILDGLADGEHVIDVEAIDVAQNVQRSSVIVMVDTIAPTVSTSPSGSSVAIVSGIRVAFSEAMNQSSVSIIVSGVTGTLSWSGNNSFFDPSSDLVYGTMYTVTVSGTDLAGNAVISSWSFTTLKDEGTISGTLKDADGNPVANATVMLSNGRSTISDSNGYFEFNNVTSGSYTITINQSGFEIITQTVSTTSGETIVLVLVSEQNGEASEDDAPIIVGVIVVIAALMIIFLTSLIRKKE